MTEEKNNTENVGSCCMFCKGGKMMHSHNGMHKGCHVFRWILGLLILWAVFMGGVKIGEIKGVINGENFGGSRSFGRYGTGMMRSGYGFQNQQNGGCVYNKAKTIPNSNEQSAPDEKLLQ
ncbi:MAG: hypothetical protein WC842_00960 [Candidatus Paceibacterota bacterium]|jgi:hypothetical protein